jgi:hypothetical protein
MVVHVEHYWLAASPAFSSLARRFLSLSMMFRLAPAGILVPDAVASSSTLCHPFVNREIFRCGGKGLPRACRWAAPRSEELDLRGVATLDDALDDVVAELVGDELLQAADLGDLCHHRLQPRRPPVLDDLLGDVRAELHRSETV